ncbi:MAG TPA: hypothetical protein VMN36_18175 [Verrucomicrobiales bacterium]|nr:hypothetical protein [Verrucomicrobiales bacterium]
MPVESYSMTCDNKPLDTRLVESVAWHEFHGFGWLAGTKATWIDEDMVVFDDGLGIALIDASRRVFLVNNVFTGMTKHPHEEMWAAIKYRATVRLQEELLPGQRDVLMIIDPERLRKSAIANPDREPFSHILKAELQGLTVAPPQWTLDGNGIVVVDVRQDSVESVVYERGSAEIVAREPLDMEIPEDIRLRTGFDEEVIEQVDAIVEESGLRNIAVQIKEEAGEERKEGHDRGYDFRSRFEASRSVSDGGGDSVLATRVGDTRGEGRGRVVTVVILILMVAGVAMMGMRIWKSR